MPQLSACDTVDLRLLHVDLECQCLCLKLVGFMSLQTVSTSLHCYSSVWPFFLYCWYLFSTPYIYDLLFSNHLITLKSNNISNLMILSFSLPSHQRISRLRPAKLFLSPVTASFCFKAINPHKSGAIIFLLSFDVTGTVVPPSKTVKAFDFTMDS